MDVFEAISTRRSVREYSSRPILAEVLERMCQALRYAPSACNFQPWRFILVTDAELRRQVAQAANGQTWMAELCLPPSKRLNNLPVVLSKISTLHLSIKRV